MTMYFEESGVLSAPAIVFIHGGGISGWMWKRQVDALKDYHCIVPDLPEHGRSIDEKPLNIADAADRIAELIKTTAKDGKAHVVGHSIGAKIIVELLSRHPDVVDHAVIISALFRPTPIMTMFFNRSNYKLTIWMLKKKCILNYQVKQFGFIDEDDRKNLAQDFRLLTVDALDDIYGQLHEHTKLPDLSKSAAPCLVIAGEKELKAMTGSVGDIVRSLKNAKGIIFKGSNHDIPWKAADDLNITIREFINDEVLTSKLIQRI